MKTKLTKTNIIKAIAIVIMILAIIRLAILTVSLFSSISKNRDLHVTKLSKSDTNAQFTITDDQNATMYDAYITDMNKQKCHRAYMVREQLKSNNITYGKELNCFVINKEDALMQEGLYEIQYYIGTYDNDIQTGYIYVKGDD